MDVTFKWIELIFFIGYSFKFRDIMRHT